MAVEIFVARHGQNEDNANGILNGHRDLPLTNLGRQQASSLGKAMVSQRLNFDVVYCSPLARALETAQIVADIAGFSKPKIFDELIERDFGIMTGQLENDIEKLCSPNVVKVGNVTYFFNPEGAETFEQLKKRAEQVIDTIRKRHNSGRVLLVCHGDIGKMIYATTAHKDWLDALQHFDFGNGDLIDVSVKDQVHMINLKQFNR